MRTTALAIFVTFIPAQAMSACPATPTSQACYNYKYQKNVEYFQIAYHNPVACDDETIRAAQDWTAVGSKFRLTQNPGYPTTYISPAPDPYFQVSFEPDYYMESGVNHPAESLWKTNNGYTVVNGESLWLTTDGDVRVDNAYYVNQKILCDNKTTMDPYLGQSDFGKTIAEEFGHSHGQGHVNVAGCAMRTPTPAGTMYNGLCSIEINALRRLFATDTYPIYGR